MPSSTRTRSATSSRSASSAAGKPLKVTVKVGVFTEPDSLKGHKGIGVELSPRFSFPVKVNVDTTDIGGPSAGLAMTLAIFDDLTPGNLTGGAQVAVTGTIDADGNVGEIGGIEQKAVAARAAGVSLFLVPQCSPNDSAAGLAGCKADLARRGQARRFQDQGHPGLDVHPSAGRAPRERRRCREGERADIVDDDRGITPRSTVARDAGHSAQVIARRGDFFAIADYHGRQADERHPSFTGVWGFR